MSQIESQRYKLHLTEELLKGFSSALRSRTLYPSGHPLVDRSCQKLAEGFHEFMIDVDSWTIVLLGGEFIYEKIPLPKISILVGPLYRLMSNRRIESIIVKRGVTSREISAFISILLSEGSVWDRDENLLKRLSSEEIKNINFHRVDIPMEDQTVSTDTDEARDIYSSLKFALTRFFISIFDPRKFLSLDLINILRRRLIDSMSEDRFAIISRLHTAHDSDDLIAHSINTAIISYVAAQSMGIKDETASDIFMAGLFHDIGIMDIPPKYDEGIIRTSEDKRIYLEHPLRGMSILRSIPGAPPVAIVAAFEHHIQWDGHGFPTLKRKGSINLASCIVALASVYENFLHRQAHISPEGIFPRLLLMAGTEFEKRVLAYFLLGLGAYPPGTYVSLTDDAIGMVVETNRADIYRPFVRVLQYPDGMKCLDETKVDLTERDLGTGSYLRSIKNSISSDDLAF